MSRISPQYKLTVLLLLLVALICVSFLLGRYAVRASDVLAAWGLHRRCTAVLRS